MADKYSELEVAPNEQGKPIPEAVDQAANAPERDTSGDAPELDNKTWAPHVSCNAHVELCLQRTDSLIESFPEPTLHLRDACPHTLWSGSQ